MHAGAIYSVSVSLLTGMDLVDFEFGGGDADIISTSKPSPLP